MEFCQSGKVGTLNAIIIVLSEACGLLFVIDPVPILKDSKLRHRAYQSGAR